MTRSIYFVIIPYLSVVLAVAVGLYRYFTDRFSYSSISSQLLENRALFWGSVPWHYGIVLILLAHVFAAAFPDFWKILHNSPLRMLTLEIGGMALGILALIGIIILIMRRILNSKSQAVTSVMDWILLADLLLQISAGVYIALFYRWGSLWYIYTASPWLRSLVSLVPRFDFISPLPWIVRFHAVNAFVVIGLFPFTRLVHIFTVPISYLWRPYQAVIWSHQPQRNDEFLKKGRKFFT
ncbi:MAG TPA: respiratory nitrate reductase subunit gamma [Nitrospiraceae bacterium]|nr:respiratory nitrate reductase subunit gamma [Nitrospiraceae bacterium]